MITENAESKSENQRLRSENNATKDLNQFLMMENAEIKNISNQLVSRDTELNELIQLLAAQKIKVQDINQEFMVENVELKSQNLRLTSEVTRNKNINELMDALIQTLLDVTSATPELSAGQTVSARRGFSIIPASPANLTDSAPVTATITREHREGESSEDERPVQRSKPVVDLTADWEIGDHALMESGMFVTGRLGTTTNQDCKSYQNRTVRRMVQIPREVQASTHNILRL